MNASDVIVLRDRLRKLDDKLASLEKLMVLSPGYKGDFRESQLWKECRTAYRQMMLLSNCLKKRHRARKES